MDFHFCSLTCAYALKIHETKVHTAMSTEAELCKEGHIFSLQTVRLHI